MSDFMSKQEANEYFAGKSKFKSRINSLPVRNVTKVYPGRKFVLFEKNGEVYRIHAALRANVITMDRDGLCVMMRDVKNGTHFRVGYIPTPVPLNGEQAVFLAIPSRCTVERTLRRSLRRPGEIMESTAIGMLVKQSENPEGEVIEGVTVFLPYDVFTQKTGKRISELED